MTITQIQESAVARLLAIKGNRYGNGTRSRIATKREHDRRLTNIGMDQSQVTQSWADVQDMVALEKGAE